MYIIPLLSDYVPILYLIYLYVDIILINVNERGLGVIIVIKKRE